MQQDSRPGSRAYSQSRHQRHIRVGVETAAGLIRTYDIVRASTRVVAALVATEDMVADLGAERSRHGDELAQGLTRARA